MHAAIIYYVYISIIKKKIKKKYKFPKISS